MFNKDKLWRIGDVRLTIFMDPNSSKRIFQCLYRELVTWVMLMNMHLHFDDTTICISRTMCTPTTITIWWKVLQQKLCLISSWQPTLTMSLHWHFSIAALLLIWLTIKSFLCSYKQVTTELAQMLCRGQVKICQLWYFDISINSIWPWSTPGLCTSPVTVLNVYVWPTSDNHFHGLSYHCYAWDTQCDYHIGLVDTLLQKSRLENCIASICRWLTGNHLRLNSDKMKLMWFSSEKCWLLWQTFKLCRSVNNFLKQLRNLGVYLQSDLSMVSLAIWPLYGESDLHCLMQLLIKLKIRSSLFHQTLRHATFSPVLSRLDYCNDLYASAPEYLVKCLQILTITAAKVVSDCSCSQSYLLMIYTTLAQQIEFKVATL